MVKTVYFDHRHVHMTSWHMSRDSVKMMSHMPKCVSHPEYQIRWGDFRRWNHQKSYRGKTPGGVVPTPLGVRGLNRHFFQVKLIWVYFVKLQLENYIKLNELSRRRVQWEQHNYKKQMEWNTNFRDCNQVVRQSLLWRKKKFSVLSWWLELGSSIEFSRFRTWPMPG